MGNIKEKFAKYGPWEWMAFVVGVILVIRPVIQYVKGDFDNIHSWTDTGSLIVPLGALVIGSLMVAAPKYVISLFRGWASRKSGNDGR